jgi:hypothetical protein
MIASVFTSIPQPIEGRPAAGASRRLPQTSGLLVISFGAACRGAVQAAQGRAIQIELPPARHVDRHPRVSFRTFFVGKTDQPGHRAAFRQIMSTARRRDQTETVMGKTSPDQESGEDRMRLSRWLSDASVAAEARRVLLELAPSAWVFRSRRSASATASSRSPPILPDR